jgi:uncharacterized membrane protein YhaH (DUF805 family)
MDLTSVLFAFNGRINRAKFWLGSVIVMVALIVLMIIVGMAGGVSPEGTPSGPIGIIAIVIYLVSLWPSIALGIKRFHDRNKSGWWVLIVLVPIIGGLWYLIECGFLEGTKGSNQFGADPLAAG